MRIVDGVTHPIDAATVRRLLFHEAAVHAVPGRRLTDLGDGLLLLDPASPEPFWNRLAAARWPDDPAAFDRRLGEVSLRFAAMGRQPHIWVSPPHDEPRDLAARLAANGFEDTGPGLLMVTRDPTPVRSALAREQGAAVTVERVGSLTGARAESAATAIVGVLLSAFGVGEERRHGVTSETVASLADARFTHYIVRIGEMPAAVARGATFDGATYLSSIGTAEWARGRGLGRLVTAIATLDGLEAGSDWVHLGVFVDNDPAIALYRRLGFASAGDPGPDMLLVGR
jgi:ribosomal protein S18 acetylase RimI-like enzyme